MAEENGSSVTAHDDPSTKLWSSYISEAEKRNRNLALSWKGDMDAILIFAGLFSASVTTFIVESYKTLAPNTEDKAVALLAQISQQLAAMSNVSSSTVIPSPLRFASETFAPPTSALICNTFWFLSLGFSLLCALSATLVEQWVRNYLQATESRPAPHERARIYAYLYQGIEKYNMATLVDAIPMLLHISLLLFFAGLVEFLHPINTSLSYLILAVLILCTFLYTSATIIPIFRRNSPYQTPLSGWLWKMLRAFHLLRRQDPHGGGTIVISGTMAQARETDATAISPERDQRDLNAMAWTLKTLRHDAEFEAFVEIIPQVVAGFDYSAKLLLHKLLHHDNLSVRLGHRIPRLLISCTGGVLEPAAGQKRAASCLAAIWSLNMMSVPTDYAQLSSPDHYQVRLRFDELTLRDIKTVGAEIPAVAGYAMSAAAVLARSILDLYVEHAVEQEYRLMEFIRAYDPKLTPSQSSTHQIYSPKHIINRLRRTSGSLKQYLNSGRSVTFPLPFAFLKVLHRGITNISDLLVAPPDDVDIMALANDTLKFLDDFRTTLNQAGFSLIVDYAMSLGCLSPPYEVVNTIRRLFLRLDFDYPVSLESQVQFLTCLDKALEVTPEGGMRVPQSVINIMLGLTRVVDDPTCALKAKSIISQCMGYFPNMDEAQKALSVLDRVLPSSTTLDLFTTHMYSNIKLNEGSWPYNDHNLAVVATIADVPMPRRHYETA